MSLTEELKDRQSPVRQFMIDHFPNTTPTIAYRNQWLRLEPTLLPTKKLPYSTLGMALTYRIYFYFRHICLRFVVTGSGERKPVDIEPWKELKTQVEKTRDQGYQLPPNDVVEEFFSNLQEVLERVCPVGQSLELPEERIIGQYCIVLALFEEIVQARERALLTSPLVVPRLKKTVSALLSIAKPHWIEDLSRLSAIFYRECKDLLSRPTLVKPPLEGGIAILGAKPDLVVDNNLLIEIKSTIYPKLDRLWLYQLIGYRLLDVSDSYGIRNVGIYMARQGYLCQWRLPELLTDLSGRKAPSIRQLSKEFVRVARRAIEQRYQIHKFHG